MFKIPNAEDAGILSVRQAQPDSVDFDALVLALKGDGVISGCKVTAQGTPDDTVAVAAGLVRIGGVIVVVSGGNETIAPLPPSGGLQRFDLVTVDAAGTVTVQVGGENVDNPVFPVIPSGEVPLAAVYIPGTDTDIDTNQIVDKRLEHLSKYTDSEAITAVPSVQYIPFGSEPITGQSYAP